MSSNDKWFDLRQALWSNIEPSVKLVALTVPGDLSGYLAPAGYEGFNVASNRDWCGGRVSSDMIERIVSDAASVSTGAEIKNEQNLIKQLIKLGHHVPLEFLVFQFLITGISKACSSQISRHRIASIVSASRRYQQQGAAFVYPLLENIDDEGQARLIYQRIQGSYKESYDCYLMLRSGSAKKGDSRYVSPVGSATSKAWSINARSLRNFLRLRLAPDAESEVRRLAYMILSIVKKITPTIFHDFKEIET